MNNFRPFLLLLFVLSLTHIARSQFVTNYAELEAALDNAAADSVIILQNKTWGDLQLNFKAYGTLEQPVIIKAETSGQVFITGDSSYIKMGGEYVYLEGFVFKNGMPTSKQVIWFRGDGDTCHHCKLLNTTFDGYNPTGTNNVKWVRLMGTYNEVAHCSFLNKKSIGSCILVYRDTLPDYHSIHHNYFAGRRPQNDTFNIQNDQDAIRIGDSQSSLTDSYTTVHDNYFYDWVGEIEVISNKSGGNKFYNNTFEKHAGLLTLRHGNGCDVFNNFFFADTTEKSGGIRVIGEGHRIFNNYIEKAGMFGSNAAGGIVVTNGRPNTPLNGYAQVKNAIIAFNTLVDIEKGIRIGTMQNSTTTLPPENITVANNIMLNCDSAITIETQPLTNPNIIGNTHEGGSWAITSGVDGNKTVTANLLNGSSQGYQRLTANSPALDDAANEFAFVKRDITGGLRPADFSLFDRGAEEFGVSGMSRPYVQSDVGVLVGAGSGSYGHCYANDLDLYHPFLGSGVYRTLGEIWSISQILDGQEVEFVSKEGMILDAGFSVELGGSFLGVVGDCP